eukprot:Em0021g331a
MQETANVYLPHLVPKVSRFTGQPSATVDSGETSVQFSLYYDIQRCTLDVQLIEVSNLPDIGGKCSSKVYVLLSSLKLERWIESMVASNSQSPAFNQTLEFHGVLLSELKDMLIAFQIHHYSANHSNNVFGVAKMLLKDADIYGACTTLGITLGQKLKQDPCKNKGDILLVITYKENHILEGSIMKATNLSRYSLPDPYVQIDMLCKNQHQSGWKSSVKNRTMTPVYNEPFQFDTSGTDINDVSLRITVYDYHKIRSSTVIGRVVLGHASHIESGRDHWAHLVQRSGQPVSYWHTLTSDLTM